MARGKLLTEEKKQDILNDIQRGMKQKEIARKYGVSVSAVARISGGIVRQRIPDTVLVPAAAVSAAGVHIPPEGRTAKDAVRADVAAGMSMCEAAKKHGISHTSAINIVNTRDEPPACAERMTAASAPIDREQADGFVFAESMSEGERREYTAAVIAEVEGRDTELMRCESAADEAETFPESSVSPAALVPAADTAAGLTVKQLIKLHWTDDILYFYEYEPGVKDGKWDFSGTELFLAYHSAVKAECMLTPEVLERTVHSLYNDNGTLRIVIDRKEENT